jgi:hypothetical protein
MSNPPPIDPLPYFTPYQQPSRRPLSVSVIGWITAIFGGLGVLGGPCILIQHQFMSGLQPNNAVDSMLYSRGAIGTYNIISQIVGWGMNVLVLSAGIGLLNLKYWARKLMVRIMIFQLFLFAVGFTFSLVMLLPAFAKLAAQHPNDPTIQMTYRIMIFTTGFSFILGLAYPILVIFFLTRPRAKAAFELPMPLPPAI